MRVDHIAIETNDIATAASWYQQEFAAEVLYQDDSWAFLKVGGTKLALVRPEQHPAHIAYSVTPEELQTLAVKHRQAIQNHRDGSRGIYIRDPAGNAIEFICYAKPPSPPQP